MIYLAKKKVFFWPQTRVNILCWWRSSNRKPVWSGLR